MVQATVTQFLNTLGVNTHFDFANSAYQNFDIATQAIIYLGLPRLRDCAQRTTTPALWRNVTNATGARFHAFLPTGSPAAVQTSFNLLPQVMAMNSLLCLEGPNEEDVPYAIQQGNSIAQARQFQIDHMAPFAKQSNLQLTLISFGAGWTSNNNWQGDYDKVGNMSAYCDFGNAHTYPNYNSDPSLMQKTTTTIQHLNGLAQLAAPGQPVITTEIGWDQKHGFTQAQVARFVLQAAFGGLLSGNPFTYFYALFDDAVGQFGLMNSDGTPKLGGLAIHNLIATLKPDSGTPVAIPPPICVVSPPAPHDLIVMLQGATTYWFVIWNEIDPARTVSLSITMPQGIGVNHPPLGSSETEYSPGSGQLQIVVSPDVTLVKIR